MDVPHQESRPTMEVPGSSRIGEPSPEIKTSTMDGSSPEVVPAPVAVIIVRTVMRKMNALH